MTIQERARLHNRKPRTDWVVVAASSAIFLIVAFFVCVVSFQIGLTH